METESKNAPAETPAADSEAPPSTGEVVVENRRVGADVEVNVEQLAHDDLMMRLAESTTGRSLSPRQVAFGKQAILDYEKHNAEDSEAWADWAGSDVDRLGYIMTRAANGELPAGPPSKYSNELEAVSAQLAARRELESIMREHPPGSKGYVDRMSRIQYLWQIEAGSTPVVGKNLRNV